MSINLSAVAVTEFDSMVKHAYANAGLLKNAVTLRNNVVGDTYKFRRMGKGLANQKASSADVTPMNVGHEFKTATLANWNAPEFTDIFDAQEVNFDEKQELATTIAGALGRRCDQLVIDAMDASTPLTTAVAAGGTNLTIAKVNDAQVELRDQGVPNTELFAVIEAGGLGGLLNDEKATSGDYQAIKALVSGEINTLVGFQFIILETRAEGGLTEAANVVDSWFFQRPSVGLAVGIDMKTEINYVPEKTSWLTNGMLKAGSVVRDEGGLVKVQYDKTA
jgi:Tfp pilus assembly protein PilV